MCKCIELLNYIKTYTKQLFDMTPENAFEIIYIDTPSHNNYMCTTFPHTLYK